MTKILFAACMISALICPARAEEGRIACQVDAPSASSMKCPESGHRYTIWVFDHTFRSSAFPPGLKAGDTLSCVRDRHGEFSDCILERRS